MKHILNNLSDEEKNSILEQHTGGMKIMNENFSKLLNAKLGDAKPLISETDKENIIRGIVQGQPSRPQYSENLESMFETMIDEIGEQIIENSYFGSLEDYDMEDFASSVSEFATNQIQEKNPNMKVNYVIYYGGTLEFSLFDEEEGIVATYRPSF